jgi:hypothetical protein
LAVICSIVGASAVLGAQQPPAEQRTFRTEVALARPPDVPVDTPLGPFIVVGVTERVGVVRFQRVGDP